MAQREIKLREEQKAVSDAKREIERNVEQQVAEQLKTNDSRGGGEAKKATAASAADIAQRDRTVQELQETLESREEKLAEAQQAQASLLKKQRELDDAKRELELTIEKRVQGGLTDARLHAKREAEDSLRLKVAEKDQTITSMQKTIES